jgi:SAM-dependent methyltransferase
MIENYEKLPNGVIKQIKRTPFNYGFEYSNNYNKLGELGLRMGYLRLGYIIGAIQTPINKILDVGYGNGDFLKAASEIIPNCFGSDISNEYNLPNKCTYINDIYSDNFDIICFFDVLEHFEDITVIKNLNTKYIVLSLPECHYISDEWFTQWKHRKPDEHLHHFNKSSLIKFMEEVGYEVINISNVEDTIRKPEGELSNILTGIFKKK